MHFHVLGPLDVIGPTGPIHLAGRRRRALLAVLLVHSGRSVSLPGLVDGIWADNPPHSAVANIRNYVSDFRRQLRQAGDSPGRLASNLTGYRLDVAAEELDLFRYSELVADGRQALRRRDHRRAADRFGLALGLWRGRPLEDLPDLGAAVVAKLAALEEQRWAVTTSWIDVRLAMGQHDELIPVLRQLVAERPLDEQVRAQLIIALHAVGRKADALVAFRDARRAVVEELGVEPGPFLQRLHSAILNNGPLPSGPTCGNPRTGDLGDSLMVSPAAATAATAASRSAAGVRVEPGESGVSGSPAVEAHAAEDVAWSRVRSAARPRPRGLPPMPLHVVGRDAVVRELEDIGRTMGRRSVSEGHSAVVAISGPPGVGTSTMALTAAYALRNQYPDGQIHLPLNGSTDTQLSVADALGGLLRALGADPARLPEDGGERIMLYRTMLADRRLLLVLDDATSARTVRPLLPGAGSCLVIVTSGRQLVELDTSWHCNLGPLTEADAVRILAELVGWDRVEADRDGANGIVASCEGLPLAVRVAGLRLSTLPHIPLGVFAARLADEERRLDELTVGNLSVRSRLARSYRLLDPTARRLLTAMAQRPDRRFTGATAASLLDVPVPVGERVLERLATHNVVTPVGQPSATSQRPDAPDAQNYEIPTLMRLFVWENPEGVPGC